MRVEASRWNEGDRCGSLDVSCLLHTAETVQELWHFDPCARRYASVFLSWKTTAEMDSNCPGKESRRMDKEEMVLAFHGNVGVSAVHEQFR